MPILMGIVELPLLLFWIFKQLIDLRKAVYNL